MPCGVKITDHDRDRIAHLLRVSELTYQEIAKRVGVARPAVVRVNKERKIWVKGGAQVDS